MSDTTRIKILLIRCNESLRRPVSGLRETNVTGIYPPLGLAYIASVLRKAQYNVRVLDVHALNLTEGEIRSFVKRNPADIIMLTSTTLIWPNVLETARIVKDSLPKALIGIGGPQLSAYPQESVSFDYIDFGVYGEGEATVLEVVDRYERNTEINNINGTVIKKDGHVTVNPAREPIEKLDEIPFPAIELFPYKKYRVLNIEYPFFTMVTSRGCPYRCAFCSQVYNGGKFRYRSAMNVVDEMELYARRYNAKELIIFDETFTVDKERVLNICKLIKDRKLKFRWNIRTRVDLVDRDMLGSLKEAGCYGLHMGVESGSQEILNIMKKDITIPQVKEAFRHANALGFETRGYFMIGYPGENLHTIKQTLRLAKELDLDWASFTVTIPHPKTDIYNYALENGYLKTDYWRDYTLGRVRGSVPYFTTGEYDTNRLIRIKNYAYLSFYSRISFITKKLLSKYLFRLIKNLFKNISLLFRLVPIVR